MRFGWIALWIMTTLYLLLLPARHYTFDAVTYLIAIEQHDLFELFHSQHLLAQWPGTLVYQLGGLRAWEAMRLAYAVLGGGTVALVYLAAAHLTRKTWVAVLAGLALWVSYGFWHFHGDPDIYSPVYFAVALLLLAYVSYLHAATRRRLLLLAGAAALAMLMHQMNALAVGIIGLSLIVLARRDDHPTTWRDVLLYGGLSLLVVAMAYTAAWLIAREYVIEQGGPALSFDRWVLRYFQQAQGADVTWGDALDPANLPVAGYAFFSAWVLPPLRADLSVIDVGLFGLMALAIGLWPLHLLARFSRLALNDRVLVSVLVLTILIKALAAFWWQPGNIKFYLSLQPFLILLAVVYLDSLADLPRRMRQLGTLTIALPLLILTGYHVTQTLPYETQGGVFVVDDRAAGQSLTIAFDSPEHLRWFTTISDLEAVRLPADFCTTPGTMSFDWVVMAAPVAASCPALVGETPLADFAADRSRIRWEIYESP